MGVWQRRNWGRRKAQHGKLQGDRLDLRRSFNTRPKAKQAKAIRRNGVTGAAAGSRYHGPHTQLVPRTCVPSNKGGRGGVLTAAAPQLRRPGGATPPDSQGHTTQVGIWMVAFLSHFVLALAANSMGSMMIRVRPTQA